MKKALISLSALGSGIMVAFAQFNTGQINGGPLLQLLALVQTIVTRLVPLAVGLAVLAFFWFLIKFIWKGSSDAKEKTDAGKGMLMSILAIFVMVSIWGIVGFLGSITGIGQGGSVPIPGVPVPTS